MLASLVRSFSALAVLVVSASLSIAEAPHAVPSLPLSFERNQGQVASQYPFLFRHNGTQALFEPGGVDLQFPASGSRAGSHLGLRLLGESAGVSLHSELPLAGRTNYLIGPNPAQWLRGVPTFSRIRYTAVYPGIDLVFYGNDSRLEHDFRIAPGADASRIAFHLDRAETLTLSPAGDLQVATGDNLLILQRPTAFQESPLGRTPVAAAFALAPDGTVTFALGSYDHTRELVVDPALTYATYLDTLSLGIAGIATDSTGATYITGYTGQSTYGTTPGAYQSSCPDCGNALTAFVTKLDPTGTKVVYSTFLGGSGYTQPFAIAVDTKGNAIIGGRTEASDYPVKNNVGSGAFTSGVFAGFVSSLSPDGSALNFSSVFRGESDTVVFSIATDASGNTFFAGNTNSSSYPVTPGALNAGTPAFDHIYAFLTKLTATGSLTYSALVGNEDPQNGGGGFIGVQGLAVDAQGDAFITGSAGTLWPTTAGAYQTTIPGAMPYDAPFVTKVAADGSHILFSTFLGIGLGQAIALDAGNNIDLLSSTSESAATYTSYLSQLSPDGSKLLHNTTLGSTSGYASYPASLAIDGSGNLWVAGSTADASYPRLHPLQSIFPASVPRTTTGFLSEFDPTGTTLKFSTFYGNSSAGITSIAIAPSGVVNIAGTTSDGIYTTPNSVIGSVTPTPPGYTYNYGFLARIDPSQPSASLCLSPGYPAFANASTYVGTPLTLPLQITSCGELPLTLSAVQSSSALFTPQDPAVACGSSVAVGASCTIPVTFLPTASGNVSSTLTFVSNASVRSQTLSVSAAGDPLPPIFSSTSLTFSTTPGVASPTQTITVTNVSDIPLNFTQTTITQPFTVNNTCDQQLAPGLSCSILVSFSSPTAGTITGSLFLAEDRFGQQTIALTGTAAAPAVTFGPSSPAAATQTVTAGQPAIYSLSTTSIGNFSGTAAFSCTGLPPFAACSFAPSSVTLAAGATTPVTLTVRTGGTTTAALHPSGVRSSPATRITLVALGLPLLWIARRRASRLARAGLLSLSLAAISLAGLSLTASALLTGCSSSGSGSSPSRPAPASTPAGTYTINVVATSASATVSTPITLVVR